MIENKLFEETAQKRKWKKIKKKGIARKKFKVTVVINKIVPKKSTKEVFKCMNPRVLVNLKVVIF